MNFFLNLFKINNIDCPRCLGKGFVDVEDIHRLEKELYWMPGRCAYCNGYGKVSSRVVKKLRPDSEYLTLDLPEEERTKLFNGDPQALQRAQKHEEHVKSFVKAIEHLYYIENMEYDQIADDLIKKYEEYGESPGDRHEIIRYIERVISSKLKKKQLPPSLQLPDTREQIATMIDTTIFFQMIPFLKQKGWELIAEYREDMFDKGIDFDLYQFRKDNETILLAWSNWFEGEARATTGTLEELAAHFNITFKFGNPEHLNKPDFMTKMEGLLTYTTSDDQ